MSCKLRGQTDDASISAAIVVKSRGPDGINSKKRCEMVTRARARVQSSYGDTGDGGRGLVGLITRLPRAEGRIVGEEKGARGPQGRQSNGSHGFAAEETNKERQDHPDGAVAGRDV